MNTFKGITVHQPWASLLALRLKRFETRGWKTSYRGPLAIHASKCRLYLPLIYTDESIREAFYSLGLTKIGPASMPTGCVVAVGSLGGCVRSEDFPSLVLHNPARERALGDWSKGRYGFEIAGVRKLVEPVPCAGFQKLWNVPPALARKLDAAEWEIAS